MEDVNLLAGTGRRCTNPPPNIAHGGWGAQKHEQAEGIDMDLWVTALALSDEVTTAVLLDFDIQILTNQRADQLASSKHPRFRHAHALGSRSVQKLD